MTHVTGAVATALTSTLASAFINNYRCYKFKFITTDTWYFIKIQATDVHE